MKRGRRLEISVARLVVEMKMTDRLDSDMLEYVRAAARLLGLPLAPDQATRVALQLDRTAAMASLLAGFQMRPDDDIAEIYRPAPFPDIDPQPAGARE